MLFSSVLTGFSQNAADVIVFKGGDLQQMVDSAPSNAVIRCDPNLTLVLSNAIMIHKPLTLVGLHARLPEKLGNTSLVICEVKGISVTDFELTGNADSVDQKDRAPLLIVHAGEFHVERGRFINSSKDGVMIDGDNLKDEDLVGGVVRDIYGRGVRRDTVSISGSSGNGRLIRNVLVDNVRCYDSDLRGAVEVSDGTDNITVRKVYVENSIYAIDVQDHHKDGQSNRNVVLEDIYALRCKHAIRTANSKKGHRDLTIRDVTAEECVIPLQVSHTANVTVTNVRVRDHTSGKPPIQIQWCHGLSVRDILVENVSIKGAGLLIENCDDVLVDGFNLRGKTNDLSNAICYRLTTKDTVSGLRISNVSARELTESGILLEAKGKQKGTLTDYMISGNFTSVADHIQGERGVVSK